MTQPQAAFLGTLVPEQKENGAGVPSLRAKTLPDSFGCRMVGSGLDGEAVGSWWMPHLSSSPTTETPASSESTWATGAALLPPLLRGKKGKNYIVRKSHCY